MTEQAPDLCRFDGREWFIDSWTERAPEVPTNEQLGIQTVGRSSANWAGRVDHFLVFRDQLYLFKVEAELPVDQKEIVPFGARRESRTIYQPMEMHGDKGLTIRDWEHRQDLLVFDDLKINFTGMLCLLHPISDPWNYPWPLSEDELEPTHRAYLTFVEGSLVSAEVKELWLDGDDY